MKYLTVNQVAELLNVHYQTVRNWIKKEQIKYVKIGRDYRIPANQFEEDS